MRRLLAACVLALLGGVVVASAAPAPLAPPSSAPAGEATPPAPAATPAAPPPAEAAEARCPVPEALALRDLALDEMRAAVARTGKLVVLTVGGPGTEGSVAGTPEATYPARLQAGLVAALPGVSVKVVNRGAVGHGAAWVLQDLPEAIRASGANLVIWASGATEAAHGADVDGYIATLQAGIDEIHQSGADVILMDLPYAPSIARILNTAPYRDAVYGTALANNVPVLRRYDLMQQWSDDDVMNLDATDPAERRIVAQHLFECLAAILTPAIAAAAR
jgi:lysophospholipase L1-like esterase